MMIVDSLKLLAPEKFDSLLGLVGAAQMLGMTLSVTICNLIVDNLGYTPAFVIFAALALVALGLCFAFLPTGPTFCSTSTRPEVNFLLYLRRFKIDKVLGAYWSNQVPNLQGPVHASILHILYDLYTANYTIRNRSN